MASVQTVAVFQPLAAAGTKNIAATTSSQNVQLFTGLQPPGTAVSVRVVNSGSVVVFVEFGNSSITASQTTSTPIPAGGTEVFRLDDISSYAAAITSTTATVYFTPGTGL